eukprot:8494901-Ditylum_brightwellii.AAC.2
MGVEAVEIMLVYHRPVRPHPPSAWWRYRQLTSACRCISSLGPHVRILPSWCCVLRALPLRSSALLKYNP